MNKMKNYYGKRKGKCYAFKDKHTRDVAVREYGFEPLTRSEAMVQFGYTDSCSHRVIEHKEFMGFGLRLNEFGRYEMFDGQELDCGAEVELEIKGNWVEVLIDANDARCFAAGYESLELTGIKARNYGGEQ